MLQRRQPRKKLPHGLRQLISMFLFIGGTVASLFFFTTLSMKVTHSEDGVLVDLRTWGFYTPDVRGIAITEVATSNVVWDIQAPYRHLAIRTVSLSVGSNPSVPAGSSSNTVVVVPESESSFLLHPGVRYRITAHSTFGGSKNKSQATEEFTMPNAGGRRH